jgi:hypothetical protein
MRKSGYDVDDAGDASNTEIGHVPTCLLEPLSLSHHVCDLAESGGFLGGSGNLGNGLSRSPNGLSVRTAATAMPNQSCVTGREPRPLPCANWPPDCLNERDLPTARGEAAFSAKLSFRLTYRVVSIRRAMQKHTTGENMFHRRRADSDDSPRNESVPTLVRVTGRSLRSPPPEIKTLRRRLLPLVR